MQDNMLKYTKKSLHVPFVLFMLKKMCDSLSSKINVCKSTKSKINTKQLKEHDLGMIMFL